MRVRATESEKRRNFLGVRWSDDEMNAISTAAHNSWLPVSSFIRQQIMQQLVGQKRGDKR
jgi:hypothetical protein